MRVYVVLSNWQTEDDGNWDTQLECVHSTLEGAQQHHPSPYREGPHDPWRTIDIHDMPVIIDGLPPGSEAAIEALRSRLPSQRPGEVLFDAQARAQGRADRGEAGPAPRVTGFQSSCDHEPGTVPGCPWCWGNPPIKPGMARAWFGALALLLGAETVTLGSEIQDGLLGKPSRANPAGYTYPACERGHPTREDGSHIKISEYWEHLRRM